MPRYQISMNDAALVRCRKAINDLCRDLQSFVERDGTALQPLGQRLALDEFQYKEEGSLGLFQIVDRSNIGMIQRGENFGFALEAADAVRIEGSFAWQDLDGNITLSFVSCARYTSPIPPTPSNDRN